MTEEIIIPEKDAAKKEKYESLIPQVKALVEGESDLIANVANMLAALKEGMGFLWMGVYFVKENKKGEKELVLGPFQGPVACSRIQYGKGVCGACWKEKKVIIVPDVNKFPGHIACSSLSRSEIVLPIIKNNEVAMVLDVDSEQLSNFDETDSKYLQQIVKLTEGMLK
ncbi:MAG TPA: GAF domain-containing protein [Bacteroidia bacterium]|nr:GAF domain-containing protein [Bacteroidia bacterium]